MQLLALQASLHLKFRGLNQWQTVLAIASISGKSKIARSWHDVSADKVGTVAERWIVGRAGHDGKVHVERTHLRWAIPTRTAPGSRGTSARSQPVHEHDEVGEWSGLRNRVQGFHGPVRNDRPAHGNLQRPVRQPCLKLCF